MKKRSENLLLYAVLWLIAMAMSALLIVVMDFDDAYADEPYTLMDALMDGGVMAVFLGVSLPFNQLFIRLFRPIQRYRGKMLAYSILLFLTNLLIAVLMTQGLIALWGDLPREEYIKTVYLFALVATFISGIHANITFQESYRRQAEEKHQLEMENIRQQEVNLQTSLIALKTQVDPHFLFNNFSILSDLIDEDTREAHEFLNSLSHVYRYKLVNMNAHLVTVANELSMLRSYVHLIQTRFEKAIGVVFPSEQELLSAKDYCLPPLVVQLLVENAIKHNAHSKAHPLCITISIRGGCLVVSNPVRPLSSEVESTGIGLRNLRERYQLLSAAQPTISNDGTTFTVTLPLIKEEK